MIKRAVIKVSLLVILAVISSIVIYNKFNNSVNDQSKFKQEYESLNDKKDDKGRSYPIVNIDEDNGMKYASFEDVKQLLTTGTGIVYFGFPECPWCRNAVPMLIQAASNKGIDEIYYYNNLDTRDTKILDEDGKIITTKEGTKEYYELIDILKDYLGPYEGLNDESIKRLYFPTVVFVLDGKITNVHIGTIEEQTDPRVPLTEKQKEKLVNIYVKYIDEITSDICDDKC